MPTICPFLWFDHEAEEAANFYTSVFKNSKITRISRYGETGPGPAGTVMTVEFELDGQPFVALNGGPQFHFNEAISLAVECKNQKEVDTYWDALSAGGEEGQCGWLKDRFGLSWQITPTILPKLVTDTEHPDRADRAMAAMMHMKKIDIEELKHAAEAH